MEIKASDLGILVLHFVNIILHSLGLYLLICAYRRNSKTAQKLFLINLALTECIANFIKFGLLADSLFNTQNDDIIVQKIIIFLGSGFYYEYMVTMFLITGDRLFGVLYPIRYSVSVSASKALKLIIGNWFVCLLVSTGILVYRGYVGTSLHEICFPLIYIIGLLNVIYLLFGTLTYCVIFWKYAMSTRRRNVSASISASQQMSRFKVFKTSKFYIPILLMTSCLILSVIPYLISTITIIRNSQSVNMFLFTLPECYVPVTLSDTVDAFIYIFMQVSVRSLLIERFCRCREISSQRQHSIVTVADRIKSMKYPSKAIKSGKESEPSVSIGQSILKNETNKSKKISQETIKCAEISL